MSKIALYSLDNGILIYNFLVFVQEIGTRNGWNVIPFSVDVPCISCHYPVIRVYSLVLVPRG